jgi:parvulin-like peptidyl-prolyl isomerase
MKAPWAFAYKLAGFVLLGLVAPALGQPPAAKPAAVVNGEPIAASEIKALLDARPPAVPLTEAQKKELRQAAVDMLIDDMLMRQFLRKNAPPANPAEVEKEMTELKEVLTKQKKSLADFLREGQQTEEQLRADIAARVQWKGYLVARFPDADLKSYYDNNKVFFDKVFVQASHILVKASQDINERKKAREKLEYLRQEILTGKLAFEDAARKYSDCPSKDKGGDIGPFPYKFVVVEPFARTAFAMKVNEISGVVATDFGMHLIKVTKRDEGEPTTFDAVRETVREVYAQDMELYQRILAEQRKNAKIEVFLQ